MHISEMFRLVRGTGPILDVRRLPPHHRAGACRARCARPGTTVRRRRPTIFLPRRRKSVPLAVDIGRWPGYGFSCSRDRARPGRDELPGSSKRSPQDGAVVEFRSQVCCRTATGLTTGPGGPQ
ncbi:hypothetical protein EAO72_08985 [Streptomyces sp. or43]|nr:hypothetical protein EAO72_08985 [Streptomyces sp. or43]